MAGSIYSHFRILAVKIPGVRPARMVAIIFLALSPPSPAFAETSPVTVVASHFENARGSSRLLFDLTGVVAARVWPMTNPARIVVELPDAGFSISPSAGRVDGSTLVRAFRFGQFAPGRARIVIDLLAPAKVLRVACDPVAGGARLTIELGPTSTARFAADARVAGDMSSSRFLALNPQPSGETTPPAEKPLIVIDPGHGGVDQGAVAGNGTEEKTIVLAFARALRERIESGGRLRVELTRDSDVFLPLEERVAFAQRANAALFLSIHADTLAAPHVEGATIYTVSRAASDSEAAQTAAQENRADQAAGLDAPGVPDEVGDILFDLTRRETNAFSRQFAHALALRWKEAGSLNKNPLRSAGFVVLKAHDVPSALLELGYVSSAHDLSRLTSPAWRERAAAKAAEAIEAFFDSAHAPGRLAGPAAPRPE